MTLFVNQRSKKRICNSSAANGASGFDRCNYLYMQIDMNVTALLCILAFTRFFLFFMRRDSGKYGNGRTCCQLRNSLNLAFTWKTRYCYVEVSLVLILLGSAAFLILLSKFLLRFTKKSYFTHYKIDLMRVKKTRVYSMQPSKV